jgi:hypothetical protein
MSKLIGLMLICAIVSPVVFASESEPAPKTPATHPVVAPPPGRGFPSLESKRQRDPNKQDMWSATSARHIRPSGRLGGYAAAGGMGAAAIYALIDEHPVWSALAIFIAIGCGIAWIRSFFTPKAETPPSSTPK